MIFAGNFKIAFKQLTKRFVSIHYSNRIFFFRILYFIIRIFILKRFNSASEPQPIAVFCLGESAYSAVRIFIDKYFNASDQETSSSSSLRDLSSPNDEEEGENKPNDVIKPNEVVAVQFTLKETLKL